MPLMTFKDLPELKQGDRVSFKIIGNDEPYIGRIEMNKFNMPCWVGEWGYDEQGNLLEEYEELRHFQSLASFGEFTEFNVLS